MNQIERIEQIIKIVKDNRNTIIYGAGEYSRLLLRYMEYLGCKDRVICIAVKNRHENEEIIQDIPVFELEELSALFRHSTWIICVKQHFLHSVISDMDECGIEADAYLTEKVMAEIEKAYIEADTNIILRKHMDRWEKELRHIRWEVEEQAEVCDVNTRTFEKYRGINRGKDVAIVATGPSLNGYKTQNGLTYIGVNRSFLRKDIPFDYLFVQDMGDERFAYEEMKKALSSLENVKIMMGRLTRRDSAYRNGYPENFISDMSSVERFFVSESSTTEPVRQDICHYPLTDCFSVVFPAIHFALFTYPRRLYLVGCDVSGGNHFYADDENKKGNWLLETTDRIKLGYIKMKRFAELYYPETEIVSINPVGLKGLFIDQIEGNE